jgi:gliding motility-associated-like protein/uncharacterized repeat protein (TIGR01451 family)
MKVIFNYFFSKVTGILLPSLFVIIFQYTDLQAQCPANSDRIYATSDDWTSLGGFLSNGVYGFDANPSTAANITTVVGLAGLGGGYYDLFFDQTFPAGTPVSIKMGKQYSGLGLISGFLVYGLNASGNSIGSGDSVDAGIINLLSADSAFEFTFVPHNSSGNQPYSGVRIYFGSLLSVADTYKVYEAYVKQSSTSLDCSSFQFDSYDDDGDGIDDLNDGIQATDPYVRKDVQDLFYGVEVLAGLDALSATASVVHPFYAADNDLDTYAILNRGVAVLNNALVRVDFKSESLIGDEIEIILSRSDNGMLQLGLINGMQINLYHQGSLVMGPITNTDLILNLELLNLVSSNDEVASITLTPPMVFDQVTVSYGGVANVLDAIRIHEINKKSVIETIVAPNVSGQVELCATDMLSIQMQDNCTHYEIFDSTNNPLTTSNNYDFELPDGLTEGDYTFYIQAIRQGCELGIPHEITIHINPNALDTDIDNVLINGMPETDLCLVSNSTIILSTQLSTISTITNPTFIWYDSNGDMISGGENGILDLGNLSAGTYTYGVSVQGDSVCPNLNPNQITFTINDEPAPTTTDATQEFCAANNPTAADIQVNESSVVWYDAPTGGNIVDPTTALADGTSYYAAYQGTTCESSMRLQVDVTVNDEPAPTTTDAAQQFCASNNPTAADIQVNEAPVVWYDAPTGGNVVDPTTALTDGTSYYAAYQGTTCESSIRLQVDVTVNDEPTPTTTDVTQEFCAANNPTAADIQVNESSVVWYDAPTGGNVVEPTTALTDGTSYYAAYQGTTCESSMRLQVDVTVNDEPTPTTTDVTQEFCAANNPTAADIQVNEAPVVWYDAPTGGNIVDPTTALTDGTSYYAAFQGTTCESSMRLQVDITVNDEPTPTTTDVTQEFCAANNPTAADIQVNESSVVWYDAPTGGNIVDPSTALTDGTSYYAAYQGTTCESSMRLQVDVTVLELGIATLDGPTQNVCYGASDYNCMYTTDSNMSNYQWIINGGTIISGGGINDDFVEVNWIIHPIGNVTVTYNDSALCGGIASKSFDINIVPCSDLTITKTADHEEVAAGDTVIFTITVSNGGTSNVTNVEVLENLPSGYTYVSHTTSTGIYDISNGIWNIPNLYANSSETLLVTVLVNPTGDYVNMASIINDPMDMDPDNNVVLAEVSVVCLTVYNEFSPNNDGENDFFIIDCIENYPNNKIEIFNRYGNVVYETSSYDNTWNGIANVSGVVKKGEYLPNGTYFYVLKIDELNYSKTGWLYLAR